MNKNTKRARARLAKEKCDVVCERMRTQHASSNLVVQKYTLHWGRQKRINTKAKVAAGNHPVVYEDKE